MPKLLETFCIVDGRVLNVPFHAARMAWSVGDTLTVEQLLKEVRTKVDRQGSTNGKWRASVTYSAAGVEAVRLVPYSLPQLKGIQLIPIHENFYAKKWANRSRLNAYKESLPPGIEPLFILDGLATDTSFTNIALERNGKLFTPSTPMLRGTKREKLLLDGTLQAIPLPAEELRRFRFVHLINAMLDPGELVISTRALPAE